MTLLLKAPSRYQEEIRKSRFLAQAVPLSRPAEVEGLLRQLSAPDATHNCWAWRFGQQYRFSDDGEPAGTAGRPILAAIEHKGFDQVQVVVTRWYGGILLGTGGLVRAYGGLAAKCLQAGESEHYVPRKLVRGHCPYSQLETFKSRLPDLEAVLEDEQFDAAGARLTLALPSARLPAAQVLLRSLSRGESELVVLQD
ncbi:MAG: YigZ family protein [Xanthomonadaceae bacterium]|nr:YigZ family protein [Xanthomonadaceae bacterium]